ncbi:MAG: hypothetical protein KKH94_10990 [Candidatus Omnitrophica bacterium]|nr:hypothetical protein [Candidatus Omnitrophota bacterium]
MNIGNAKEHYFESVSCPVCTSSQGKSFIKVTYGQLKQKPSLDYSIVGIAW